MTQDTPIYRRLLAVALLGALPTLAATIPLLDLVVGDGRAAVESRHLPGTHGHPHNHLICIQQQASQWAPASSPPTSPRPTSLLIREKPEPAPALFASPVVLPHPRAPPAV